MQGDDLVCFAGMFISYILDTSKCYMYKSLFFSIIGMLIVIGLGVALGVMIGILLLVFVGVSMKR